MSSMSIGLPLARLVLAVLLLAFAIGVGSPPSVLAGGATPEVPSGPPPAAPVPGRVTLLDLGAKSCVPCRMMAPILAELETEYAGRASVVFIDVSLYPDQARRFGVRAIPTQVFFDADGKEVSRHMGFMSKDAIVAELKKLGVK